jgi:hypothetical protein
MECDMKGKAAIMTIAVGILAGCGHDHAGGGMPSPPPPPPPPASTAINVTTPELLANYATQPSETATPLPVNDQMFTITDTSETTTPISVNSN